MTDDEKRAVTALLVFSVSVVLALVCGPDAASILLEFLSYLP